MSKFPVVQIALPEPTSRMPRPGGAIAKYWLDLPDLGRCLIKADLRGAWVEKIAATLAAQIALPVAGCELVERADGQKMVASPTYLAENSIESPGEVLLISAYGDNYPYNPTTILSVIDRANISLPSSFTPNSTIATASDLMTGYLIFDAWIGNLDRHSKNWGIQQYLDGRVELLPTYDHGLSLGVRIPEDKLPLDLTDFSGSLRSSIASENSGTLSMNDLARRLIELKPEAAKYWCERIGEIERPKIAATFARVPDGWANGQQIAFAIDVCVASRDRLLTQANAPSVTPPEPIVSRQSILPKRSSPSR